MRARNFVVAGAILGLEVKAELLALMCLDGQMRACLMGVAGG